MRSLLIFPAIAAVLVPAAGPTQFDLKDPKGVSGMAIKIDSKLEPVRGHANGVSGMINFDPASPEKSSGTITIDAKSVFLGSQAMSEAMHGPFCLDVAKHPTIQFKVTKISKVTAAGSNTWRAEVSGDMTLVGVTRPITAQATVEHLPGMLKSRGGMAKDGDLLKINSKFSFKRSDFKLAPDLSTNIIGDVIEIDLASIGVAPK